MRRPKTSSKSVRGLGVRIGEQPFGAGIVDSKQIGYGMAHQFIARPATEAFRDRVGIEHEAAFRIRQDESIVGVVEKQSSELGVVRRVHGGVSDSGADSCMESRRSVPVVGSPAGWPFQAVPARNSGRPRQAVLPGGSQSPPVNSTRRPVTIPHPRAIRSRKGWQPAPLVETPQAHRVNEIRPCRSMNRGSRWVHVRW